MKYTTIKGTALQPSALCLGGGPLCDLSREAALFELLDFFFDQGGNFIDIANIYGKWLPGGQGTSEILLGRWMKSRGNSKKLIVSTKGGHPFLESMEVQRLSRKELAADLEESLGNLQVDCIDLYWLHRDDTARPAGEILESLNAFIKAGKIRHIGTSNWSAFRIAEANAYAAAHGLEGFCANQPLWSLAQADMKKISDQTLRNMDEEMFALHKETGMTAVPYSSQAGGYFQKKAQGREIPPSLLAYENEINIIRLIALQKLSNETGKSVNQLALAWLLCQPFPVVPIVGCSRIEQLQESLGAIDIELTPAQLAALQQ